MLRPRCWSGMNRTLPSPSRPPLWSKAQRRATWAFDEVHTVPPCRPVNALIAAVEFMYVTGTVRSATPASASTSQASSTCAMSAMSAIEQPAWRSGSTTAWPSWVRTSADSAMKCTPQKMTYSACGLAAASRASLNESPVTSARAITSSRW